MKSRTFGRRGGEGRGAFTYLAEEGIGALQIGQFNAVDVDPLQFGVPGSDGHVQALAGDMHLSPIGKRGALFFLSLFRARREAVLSSLFRK